MSKRKQDSQVNSNKIATWATVIVSVIALGISGVSLYKSVQPEETKLTIKSSKVNECFNRGRGCYKLFIYNNDKAPCFEFTLDYDKNSFDEIVLLKGYEKSNLFNAKFDGKSISFPAMPTIPIISKWLGYLDRKQIAYFAFFPRSESQQEKKVTISCVDYKEEIVFK